MPWRRITCGSSTDAYARGEARMMPAVRGRGRARLSRVSPPVKRSLDHLMSPATCQPESSPTFSVWPEPDVCWTPLRSRPRVRSCHRWTSKKKKKKLSKRQTKRSVTWITFYRCKTHGSRNTRDSSSWINKVLLRQNRALLAPANRKEPPERRHIHPH